MSKDTMLILVIDELSDNQQRMLDYLIADDRFYAEYSLFELLYRLGLQSEGLLPFRMSEMTNHEQLEVMYMWERHLDKRQKEGWL